MNTETTMSPADFFALDRQCAQIVGGEVWCLFDTEKKRSVRAAVAALVAEREALAERVKALEELASASRVLLEEWGRRAKRLRQVADAVAELIAAAERGLALAESGAIRARQSEQDEVAEWADMLAAALAACKPATGGEE